MTREQAEEKAARLTARGVPTYAKKCQKTPGGYQTRTKATQQASDLKYQASEKGRVRDRRSKLGRENFGGVRQTRLNMDGARFREPDLLALRASQSGKCFVLDIPLDGTTSNGVKVENVDHRYSDGFVRALLHRDANIVAGFLEKHGITTYEKLNIFATRMAALFMLPFLAMNEDEIRRAKAQARRRAK